MVTVSGCWTDEGVICSPSHSNYNALSAKARDIYQNAVCSFWEASAFLQATSRDISPDAIA
jgi:hypothetical protein